MEKIEKYLYGAVKMQEKYQKIQKKSENLVKGVSTSWCQPNDGQHVSITIKGNVFENIPINSINSFMYNDIKCK